MAQDSEPFDLVSAQGLELFSDLVRDLGGDPEALLGGPQPDPATVTYRRWYDAVEHAAVALACPDFGMRLAVRQRGLPVFGPLGPVMRNSRTFGDALRFVSSHMYAHSLAARMSMLPVEDFDGMFSQHEVLVDGLSGCTQAVEQIMLLGHLGAIEITGGHARVRRVHLRHQPVSEPRIYRRYFGCEVRFGQEANGVFYSDRDLATPVINPDAHAYSRAIAAIEAEYTRHRPPLHAQVRDIVMNSLADESCRNESAAARLGRHPRTLHRQLAAEGTSFQRIKDEVRRDVMLYYLQRTRLSLALISEKLGFAEQSVMSRSCRKWFGASPSQLRAGGSAPAI